MFYHAYLLNKDSAENKHRIAYLHYIQIGVNLQDGIMNLQKYSENKNKLLPIDRASASVYFDQLYHNVNWVSQLSGWPAKDRSGSSFPGDHGMMLLIFAVYMWKYIGKDAFIKAMAVFIIFSLPRIMGGAHWFTDVFVGSVSFVLLVLSWILLTPLADIFIGWLEQKLPLRWFVKKRE